MKTDSLHRNLRILNQLLKGLVSERFKRMAKESQLSKYSNRSIDPVLLVDVNLQVEREAIQLAEISLLELITHERLQSELRRSAQRIQKSFQDIFNDEDSEEEFNIFTSDSLIQARQASLQSRVVMYSAFLTVTDPADSPVELAGRAFVDSERFEKKLGPMLSADRRYYDELVRAVPQIHRFLFRKQADLEIEKIERLWKEFQEEAFRRPRALP